MSALDGLLQMVKDSVLKHTNNQNQTGFDPSNLISHIEDLFGQHAASGGAGGQNVKPASQDPYGDPANQGGAAGRNVKPASQDPYGDPADEPRQR